MKKRQKPGITKNDCLVASLTAAIVICSVCFISFLNYQKTWASIIQGYQNQSIRIYHCLDDYIFVDMFTAINTPEDMQKQIYLEVQDKLKTIRDAMGIRYLYTAKVADNGQYIYVVDGLSREAGDFAAPGTPIEQEIIPNMNKALQGEQVLPDKMLDTQWGKIANAYFPIHENRADSKVIGVIGIEFDMEEQAAALDGIKTSAVETTVILTILAVLLSVPLYRRITRIYQKASRAKSDFLSNMSHEMRTPLNAISGMTYIGLQAVQDEEKVRDCLVKIQSSTAYMTMLINDVLDMARIESGKILLREEDFQLTKLAYELLTLLQYGVDAKGMSFGLSRYW